MPSLRLRLTLIFIGAVTLTLAGFGFYGHNKLVNKLNDSFQAMQEDALIRLAHSVSTPLWEINTPAVANILRAQLANPDIAALAVENERNETVVAFERKASGVVVDIQKLESDGPLTLEKPIFSEAAPVQGMGRLLVRFSRDKLDATLESNAEQLLLQIVAVDAVLILLLLASLRAVFAPLAELREALMQLAGQEGATAQVTELPEGRYREMAGVTRGFNLAVQRIRDESQRQEEKFKALLESAPDAMIIVNSDGIIVVANRLATSLFGWAREEMLGQKIEMLIPQQFRGHHPEQRKGFFGAPSVRAMGGDKELLGLRKDGSIFAVEISLSPIETEEGLLVSSAIRDVTQRKAAEEQLHMAKEQALAATQAKSDFLANMSHEIRTPMNAIIGMSHLALQTNLDKRQRNYIEKVQRAGENLLGIINDILDFSKIEAGKLTVETIDFSLDDVMDNLANLIGLKAEEKALELLFKIAPDVPVDLIGDPLRIGQVLVNLGNNAVKFTESGEVVVAIERITDVGSKDEGSVMLHFSVTDSGIGMTAEQCARLFQSFSQADASTTRKYGGSGLGLAISKNLVELMDGRIWVESEIGKGSSFHCHARFGLQKDPQPRRMFRADELLGTRVLVVDDNAAAREILSAMARTFGLEADLASSGREALGMVARAEQQSLHYDLVLMDWKMPGMDGVEAVQRLHAAELTRMPAVIMVTAYGREEALSSAADRGVNLHSVLTKPVTPSTLLEAIGLVLGKGALAETHTSVRSHHQNEAMAHLRGARVLLVEDNEMNQELAVDLLSNAGIEVVVADDGQQALDILAQDMRFDGVLMDCQMPVMDGYEATRILRSNPKFANLPIVAMTANVMASDRQKVLDVGMQAHIAKPLNVAEMFSTLAHWIHPAADSATTIPFGQKPTASGELPELAGIDTRAGLATTMNNMALYRRLLGKFRTGQGEFAQMFEAARQGEDASAPARVAHTLKGTAGNIGARGVQAMAGELEAACLANAPAATIDALLPGVLSELTHVIAALAALESDVDSASDTTPGQIDPEQLRAQTARLKKLLADSDAEVSDLWDTHADLFKAAYPQHWRQIQTQLSNFDFELALLTVDAAEQEPKG